MRSSLRRCLLALPAAAFAACATFSGGSPEALRESFPIGIYNVADPAHLKTLKEAGFDAFYADAPDLAGLDKLAKTARRHGMRMITSPRPWVDGPVLATRRWPVLAWYLMDEPRVNGMSPKELAALSERVGKWDPERLQTFVIGKGSTAEAYGAIGDVLMLDWYPVRHYPLDSVGAQIDEARLHIPADKPLWMVIQAFDWAEEREVRPRAVRTRFPTFEEMRFMAYFSVLSGARGIFFFRFHRPWGGTLLDTPELWHPVAAVARELALLKPVFERGRPVALPFQPSPDGPRVMARRHDGRDYVIIANHKAKSYLKVPEELLDPTWKPLFSRRRGIKDLLSPLKKGHYLRPHQVLVLEGPAQGAASRTW